MCLGRTEHMSGYLMQNPRTTDAFNAKYDCLLPVQAPFSALVMPTGQLSKHWYPPSVLRHCWWAGHTFLMHSLMSVQWTTSIISHLLSLKPCHQGGKVWLHTQAALMTTTGFQHTCKSKSMTFPWLIHNKWYFHNQHLSAHLCSDVVLFSLICVPQVYILLTLKTYRICFYLYAFTVTYIYQKPSSTLNNCPWKT